jgi:hypothetical protein
MSDPFVHMVLTMRPSHSAGRFRSLDAQRNRSILMVLAHEANDDGICLLTLAELSAMTCYDMRAIDDSLQDFVAGELVTVHERTTSHITCELNRGAIEDMHLDIENSYHQLVPFGLTTKPLGALMQHRPEESLDALAAAIEQYLKYPVDGRMTLDQYLKIPGFGPKGGKELLAAYAAWKAERRLPTPTRVHTQAGRVATEG